MYNLTIEGIAYSIPLGQFNNYIITSINIQRLPNINVIIHGYGMNTDPTLADIELKGLVRQITKSNKMIAHHLIGNNPKY